MTEIIVRVGAIVQRSEQGAAYHEKVFERCSEVMKLVQVC